MAEQFTATVAGEVLTAELAAALSLQPRRNARYRIVVEEIEQSDEEKRHSLRVAIQRGRDDVAAGRKLTGQEAFNSLKAKHFPNR